MLSLKDTLKVLQSYNINSTTYGPSIYNKENKTGICLEIKDSTYGFLTRYFTFNEVEELETFLKKYTWYKKNQKKHKITLSFNNYEIPNPTLIYSHNEKTLELEEMLNFESKQVGNEKKETEEIEKESINLNIENLKNYLTEIKRKKEKEQEEKNSLKIKENDLKYELVENLTKYYGKEKTRAKKTISVDINHPQEKQPDIIEKKNIQEKSIEELENELKELIKRIKEEELDEKYLINIYSNKIYKYNIEILNKQIDFVKRKIESEKNFNLKGTKMHNIDEELKTFLKTSNTPISIKQFLKEQKQQINEKYDQIKDLKNSYFIISGIKINLPVTKKEQNQINLDPLEYLNLKFDELEKKKKAQIILYNSFYKNICNEIMQKKEQTKEELQKNWNLEQDYQYMEEIVFNELNYHYLANYFKYINFKDINTYTESIIEIAKAVEETKFTIPNSLTIFCIENKDNQTLFSIEPIYNKKNKTYVVTLPIDTNILYIPDKIIIDSNSSEMSIISTKNIYLKSKIMDTSESIIVNKYQKITEKDSKKDMIITKDLKLKNTYVFNVGILEGEE